MRKRTAGVSIAVFTLAMVTAALAATGVEPRFTDAARQAGEFHAYSKSIVLTPEQEAIKREALSQLKAPCCDDNGLDTCCCDCNLAKTAWGLANYLIAEQHYDAARVRTKVAEWLKFVNPNGFTGDVCYTPGGCLRPISANGCGGMREPVVP